MAEACSEGPQTSEDRATATIKLTKDNGKLCFMESRKAPVTEATIDTITITCRFASRLTVN